MLVGLLCCIRFDVVNLKKRKEGFGVKDVRCCRVLFPEGVVICLL